MEMFFYYKIGGRKTSIKEKMCFALIVEAGSEEEAEAKMLKEAEKLQNNELVYPFAKLHGRFTTRELAQVNADYRINRIMSERPGAPRNPSSKASR